MRDQQSYTVPYPSRHSLASGDFAAFSLGKAVLPESWRINTRPKKRHVCKVHNFRRGKWFFRCVDCGHIKDFSAQPRIGKPSTAGVQNN